MTAWVIATRNRGKLVELSPLLAANGISGVTLDDTGLAPSPLEDGLEVHDTFEQNALAKARYFAAQCGLPCIADDSGLAVDVLDGAPGVRSRRFAMDRGLQSLDIADEEEANNRALIEACRDTGMPPPWRARYTCAAAFVSRTREVVALGHAEGVVRAEPEGTSGFGFDPFFWSSDLGVTFAVASREEKQRVSHRSRAIASLLVMLEQQQRVNA